jgi:hypothetical protein
MKKAICDVLWPILYLALLFAWELYVDTLVCELGN